MATKTALVTGGSRGIGRGIVIELARRGWSVTFSYLSDAVSASETSVLTREAGLEASDDADVER